MEGRDGRDGRNGQETEHFSSETIFDRQISPRTKESALKSFLLLLF